jgi:hypothetical protein
MHENPYQAPATYVESEHGQSRLLTSITGLSFGGLCGALGGFAGGAFGGLTYRLRHDIVFGGDGFFGVFERIATPTEFALFHGTVGAFILALVGCVFGALWGFRAADSRLGALSIIAFSFAGLLTGLLIGSSLTDKHYFLRRFMEGPFASALLCCTTAAIAWIAFCNRMNNVASDTTRCMTLFLRTTSAIAAGFLSVCATIIFFNIGTDILQVASRFGGIAAICGLSMLIWKQQRLMIKRPS